MSAQLKSVPKKDRRIVNCTVSTYIDCDVDVDLADIPTEDLQEELAERDSVMPNGLVGIYELMALGKREDAYEAMRQYIMDVTGRILP